MGLTDAKPRSQIIQEWPYGLQAAAPPPPPDEPPRADEPEDEADEGVDSAIKAAQEAVAQAVAAQAKDPDADEADKDVDKALKSAAGALAEAVKAQGKDTDAPAPPAKAPPPKVKAKPEPPAAHDSGAAAPVNPDPNSVCQEPGCEHPAASHDDGDYGAHTGACLEAGCNCPAFSTSAEAQEDADSDQMVELAADEGEKGPEEASSGTKTPAPEVAELPEAVGPAFSIPVGIVEGEPTGDGRKIAVGALDWRTPPLPLMGLATGTHDPSGMSGNDPSIICGRIDTLGREPGPTEGTEIITAKGHFLANDDGHYFASLAEQMGRIGVSADVAVEDSELKVTEVDPVMGMPIDGEEVLTKGTIMAITIVPTPAFEGAYLVLGDGETVPDPIPQESDNEPQPIMASIHFMTYSECEPCMQQDVEVLEASGGPMAPPAEWFANPEFTEGDGRLVEILDQRSNRVIGGKYACPLTVTEDGRVYGHLAPWGVCHSGFPDRCVMAPHSGIDYAHFKRGQHITTAEGDTVRVGVITMDKGHAPLRTTSTAAMAHYDDTSCVVADVNVGEDEYGIWVAGALRPEVTEERVRRLRAASLSGDWRNMGSGLELVAALAVNQPGYPIAQVASGQQEAIVATGASVMHHLKHGVDEGSEESKLTRALMPLLENVRQGARGRLLEGRRSQQRKRLKAGRG